MRIRDEKILELITRHHADAWDCYSRGNVGASQLHILFIHELEEIVIKSPISHWTDGLPVLKTRII